ncbi:RnfH family protein [Uliginosibacterium gangwonense]|uniref:RnfH family protein n=1 Tax=Uliginosibacterium gangwonense TaxID=392736 RepID=UPI0003720372|nr:RnfH family protein [Uliginosibacterium gangwonense]
MQVSVAYAEANRQVWLEVEVTDEEPVVRHAIDKSGILKLFPHIDLASQRVGVFGRAVKLEAPLREGDRVEIYRPIVCDPQSVPRRPGFELDTEE